MEKNVVENVKVTLIKSTIGFDKRQDKIVKALGFTKLNQTRILPLNDCIKGSLDKIKHLVKVEKA